MLTQDRVKELFDYRSDGSLARKTTKGRHLAGSTAGSVTDTGYMAIGIDGKIYRLHRIIFLWHHGYLPNFVDHIDCDKLNNRIENLRECTKSENGANQIRKSGSSKYIGVCLDKRCGKWHAQIGHNGKCISLGRHDSEEYAAKIYDKKKIELFGEFASVNFVH